MMGLSRKLCYGWPDQLNYNITLLRLRKESKHIEVDWMNLLQIDQIMRKAQILLITIASTWTNTSIKKMIIPKIFAYNKIITTVPNAIIIHNKTNHTVNKTIKSYSLIH